MTQRSDMVDHVGPARSTRGRAGPGHRRTRRLAALAVHGLAVLAPAVLALAAPPLAHAAAALQPSRARDTGAALRDTTAVLRAARDSSTALADSVVVRPLPGGVSAATRWLFNLPQWLQIAGVVLGALGALAILWWAWRSRTTLVARLRARPRAWQIGLAALAATLLLAFVGTGAAGWNYVQHDNGFCVSCHVMTPAFGRFQTSEHRKLQCHDCHQQSVFASARQLYLWVAERPQEIGPHAPVPTRVCAECHVQERPDSTWQRIVATAGHRVHLFSDSSALKGKVQCVTCHGQEVHRFVPVDRTCAQSGCHESMPIRLGRMQGQTSLHCVGCHAFTRPASELASVDSASRLLSPAAPQCLGCHEMRRVMGEFDVRKDPHGGACGACHDPHEQRTPAAAFESCTTSGCHAGVDTVTPMHRGLSRRAVADCGSCHQAHEWTVRSGHGGQQPCLACHQDIFDEPARRRSITDERDVSSATAPAPGAHLPVRAPPHTAPRPNPRWSERGAPTGRLAAYALALGPAPHVEVVTTVAQPAPRPDSARAAAPRRAASRLGFSHRIHRDLACESCHSSERRHGETLVRSARDCQACHHDPQRVAVACQGCHTEAELADTTRIPVTSATSVTRAPSTRVLPFAHVAHRTLACRDCHTTPVSLAPRRDCTGCHAAHHRPENDCTACHQPVRTAAHGRAVHQGCAGTGCHVDAVATALPARRSVCLSCHQDMARHKPGRECADCHRVAWSPGARSAE